MSGSGGNAFLDLLRALAPVGVPVWLLILLAALSSIAVAATLVGISARLCGWLERRLPGERRDVARRDLGSPIGLAGTFGALAVYPLAPHVFFADLDLGLFVILALLSVATFGVAIAALASQNELTLPGALADAARAAANGIPMILALLAAVIIAGTSNLIEASRVQSDWFGMGWSVFKNPFALPAVALFFVVASSGAPGSSVSEHTRMFALSAIAAVFFFGGFESPLTWGLRQSLGEDPGFLNHVILSDGSTQTRIAIGGLVFQLVCAGTLLAKTVLGISAILWLRRKLPGLDLARGFALGRRTLTSLGLLCMFGAGVWEWARATLWSGG